MSTGKKTPHLFTLSPFRLGLLALGSILLCLTVAAGVAVFKLNAALRRPQTYDAIANAAGLSPDTIARQVTVEALLQRLPAAILGIVGDPAQLIPEPDRQTLNQMLRDAVTESYRDTVSRIPDHLQSDGKSIEVAIGLREIREFLIIRVEKKTGPLVSMMIGPMLREGAGQIIPDRMVLEEQTTALTNALSPLKAVFPALMRIKVILGAVAALSLILIALGAGLSLHTLSAVHCSVALAGLSLSIVSADMISRLLLLVSPNVPAQLLMPVATILKKDIQTPGLALMGAGGLLVIITVATSIRLRRSAQN